MKKTEFKKYLLEQCPWVDTKTLRQFETYKKFLQEENQKYNLTRLDKDELVYSDYFLESLVPYLKTELFKEDSDYKLLDIGSGSGIPGIVLKLIFKNLKLTLLDSNAKKTEFLLALVKKLKLEDVEVVYDRAENYVLKHREEYDIVTSRAVSGLYKILEISAGFAKVNGYLIEPKSLKAQEELLEAEGTIKTLYLDLTNEISFNWYEHSHTVFIFEKKVKTPLEYPRSWAQICKKPL